MASEYRMALPDERELAAEIERTQALLQARKGIAITSPEAVQERNAIRTKRDSDGKKKTTMKTK
jgi:hypothetical protein